MPAAPPKANDSITKFTSYYVKIERAAPPGAAAGDRYDERQMAMLDRERARPPEA